MKYRFRDCGQKESRRQAHLRGILSAFSDPHPGDSPCLFRPLRDASPLLFIPAIHILELLEVALFDAAATRTGFCRNVIVDAENESEQLPNGWLQRCVASRVQGRR